MKALSLWQPWASLVAMGEKRVETRCWTTDYRGELAIHATMKRPPRWLGASAHTDPFRDEIADVFCARRDRDDRTGKRVDDVLQSLPYGKVLCIVNLFRIEETSAMLCEALSERELVFGNYEAGRYAWHLQTVKVFDPPIEAKGNRMLWNWKEQPMNLNPSELKVRIIGVLFLLGWLLFGCATRKPKAAIPTVPLQPDGTTITCFWLNAKQAFFCPTTLPLQGIEPARVQQQWELVPGHPNYHLGPEHLQCDAQNNCEWVRSWLDKDGKQVLTPVGCWLAKTRITWLLGDKPSMCEKKP